MRLIYSLKLIVQHVLVSEKKIMEALFFRNVKRDLWDKNKFSIL